MRFKSELHAHVCRAALQPLAVIPTTALAKIAMESPSGPVSPSASTPSSGDEDTFETQFSNTSPHPKRRAVASGSSGGPSHRTRHNAGKQPSGFAAGGSSALSLMGLGDGGGAVKDEVVDIPHMNKLKARMSLRLSTCI